MATTSGVLHYLVTCHGFSTKNAHVLVIREAGLVSQGREQRLTDEETGHKLLATVNHECNGLCHGEPEEKA